MADAERIIPALHEMSAWGRVVASAYHEAGRIEGDAIGYQRAHDEWHARAERSAAIVAQIAKRPAFADLCLIRNEPEAAARQLEILHERGIAA